MLLGKRPRPAMRRTTSMSELPPELGGEPEGAARERQLRAGQGDWLESGYVAALATPRGGGVHRRSAGEFVLSDTAPFLRACGLCKRRLGPGRDTYMYRGEIAFCSLECRQQQISQDERKEKCSLTSIKDAPPVTPGSESSNNGETIAAA